MQYYQLKHGFHENIRDILFAKIGLLCWLGWETVISTIQTPAKIVFAEWVQLAASCGTLYCFIALTKRTFKYCKYCTSFKQSRRTHTSKMGVKRILSNLSITFSHYGISTSCAYYFLNFPFSNKCSFKCLYFDFLFCRSGKLLSNVQIRLFQNIALKSGAAFTVLILKEMKTLL